MGFGALGISGAEITSKELTMEVDSLMWGEDEDTSLTDFKVQDVTFAMSENADAPISASLKSFSGTGLRGERDFAEICLRICKNQENHRPP